MFWTKKKGLYMIIKIIWLNSNYKKLKTKLIRKILDIYKLKTKLKINNFKIKFLKKIVFYLLV